MKNVITSITTHITAEGMRISFTYSQINETGEIVKSNERVTRIVTDDAIIANINALNDYAMSILEG